MITHLRPPHILKTAGLALVGMVVLENSLQASSVFYVSPTGKDENPGSESAPFATLAKARDAVRAADPLKGATVWIKGGSYELAETFVLTDKDSGSKDHPVIYRAVTNENPCLQGSVLVDPQKWQALAEDAKVRVNPKVKPEQLRELDLSGMNLTRAKEFAPGNRFTDEWFSIDLFANDKRQPLSQWPNPNENIRGKNDPGWVTCNGSKSQDAFFYGEGGQPDDGDVDNELDLDGTQRGERWKAALASGHEIWLKGLWRTSWEPHTIKVAEVNTSEKWIRFVEPPPIGMGSKYTKEAGKNPAWRVGSGRENWFALNLLEEIDQPGEWAIDVAARKLYYYPPAPLETLKIRIADRDTALVKMDSASFVQFVGISFEGGMGVGLEMNGGEGNLIAGCSFRNIGGSALKIDGGRGQVIQGNDIFDGAGWGIELRNLGDRAKLIPSKVAIENNHIHHIGNLAFREAIRMENCEAVTVAHNLMHDLPKGAVRTDLINDCIFEYNEVHNNALKESDTGTFYNYGGWSTYGNVFRYNFTHHTNRSNGFYSDDGDSGDIFYGNVVQDAVHGLHFGGGHDLIARNNLFVGTKDQNLDDRGIARNYRLGTKYEKNLRDMNPEEEPWKSYGQRLKKEFNLKTNLWSDVLDPKWKPELPNGSGMFDNVSVAGGDFRKPKNGDTNVRDNLMIPTIEEAQFYNYAEMDLRSNSPQILAKVPDLNTFLPLVGLRKDAYRVKLPTRKETGGLSNRGKEGDMGNEDQLILNKP